MQKLAFVSTMEVAPWGGSEELWSQTALRLAQRGVNVVANVKWWPEPAKPLTALQAAGGQIEWRKPPSRVRRVAKKIWPRQSQWLDRVRPTLVVISQGDHLSGYQWAEECRKRSIRYALIAQAACEYWWPADDQLITMTQAYEGAQESFFVSEANLKLTRRQLAIEVERATVVRNPFNLDYDCCPKWPQEETITRLACVARLEPSAKGQDILFEVLRQEKWRQRPVSVTLYGKGAQGQSLRCLKDRYGLANVTFGGFCSDVASIWENHQALVLPSRYEGLPLAVVEALLCGRPVITTDIAGNAELLEDNVTGFVAAAPTPSSLDEAMERAWSNRSRWRSMGQLAAVQVRQQIPRDPIAVFADHLMKLMA